jgi:hypothetical protein
MELALRDEWEVGRMPLPVLPVAFRVELADRSKVMTVTSLDAAHRIADAIFRDSLIEEGGRLVMFRMGTRTMPTAYWAGVARARGPRGTPADCRRTAPVRAAAPARLASEEDRAADLEAHIQLSERLRRGSPSRGG